MRGNGLKCCQYLNGYYWSCGGCSSEALDSADFDSKDFEDEDVAAEDEADEFADLENTWYCGGSCGHCKQRYCSGVQQRKSCKYHYCSAEELAEYFPEDLLINNQE